MLILYTYILYIYNTMYKLFGKLVLTFKAIIIVIAPYISVRF